LLDALASTFVVGTFDGFGSTFAGREFDASVPAGASSALHAADAMNIANAKAIEATLARNNR